MYTLVVALCLVGQAEAREGDAPAEPIVGPLDYLRGQYRDDAEKYVFHADAERQHELKHVAQPVLRWATDDDWSGDVFVWTDAGLPSLIGCILSGPAGDETRHCFHEFHLLAEQPIAPAGMQTRRNWQPEEGLARIELDGGPKPADSPAARLTQMRQICRGFTAKMEADGVWELRFLPQPLFRYGGEQGAVADGALFTWVWNKGTDPELILLVECRRTDRGLTWHYAPVRFSTRELWLKLNDKEVWRVAAHKEPPPGATNLLYTTEHARMFPSAAPATER
jgi:hypothetical protein